MSGSIIMRAEGLWKKYGLPPITGQAQHADTDANWVLKDISFELERGQSLGIIGRNGAGKSTLLRLLAGVSPPTRGKITLNGRMFPIIEITAGIHPELTGRENARLLSEIIGVPRRKIGGVVEAIEDFCELDEWFDRPVWTYSSGMFARVGMGVALFVDAELLLVDEVLAVGDLSFQKKCIRKVSDYRNNGGSIILVSHSPYLVERTCDHAMLVEHGEVSHAGSPRDVMLAYYDLLNERTGGGGLNAVVPEDKRPGTGDLRMRRIEVLNAEGRPVEEISTGEDVTLRLHYHVFTELHDPNFSVRFVDQQNTVVMVSSSILRRVERIPLGDGYIDCRIPNFPLLLGSYSLNVKVGAGVNIDNADNLLSLKVNSNKRILTETSGNGIFYTDARWGEAMPFVEPPVELVG